MEIGVQPQDLAVIAVGPGVALPGVQAVADVLQGVDVAPVGRGAAHAAQGVAVLGLWEVGRMVEVNEVMWNSGREAARDAGAVNIGLTGFQGGSMKQLCDICIIIPSENMQVIEDLHLSVTHAIFSVLRQRVSDHVQIRTRAVSQFSG